MKVIKKGEAHRWDVYYCECPLCRTQVKILKGDPEVIEYHNVRDSFQEQITWKCPVCEQEVLTKTATDFYGSGTMNLIKEGKEVITLEEKEEIESWDTTVTKDSGEMYCTGKWDCNR